MQLSHLADELLWHVCAQVPPEALLDRVVLTCSAWNGIIKEDAFWREYATHYAGLQERAPSHPPGGASSMAALPGPGSSSGEGVPAESPRALLRHFPLSHCAGAGTAAAAAAAAAALTPHQIKQLLLYLQPRMHPGSPADPRPPINCLPPRNLCRYYHSDLRGAAGRLCNASTTDHGDNEDLCNTLPLGVGVRHTYTREAIAAGAFADDDRLEDILE